MEKRFNINIGAEARELYYICMDVVDTDKVFKYILRYMVRSVLDPLITIRTDRYSPKVVGSGHIDKAVITELLTGENEYSIIRIENNISKCVIKEFEANIYSEITHLIDGYGVVIDIQDDNTVDTYISTNDIRSDDMRIRDRTFLDFGSHERILDTLYVGTYGVESYMDMHFKRGHRYPEENRTHMTIGHSENKLSLYGGIIVLQVCRLVLNKGIPNISTVINNPFIEDPAYVCGLELQDSCYDSPVELIASKYPVLYERHPVIIDNIIGEIVNMIENEMCRYPVGNIITVDNYTSTTNLYVYGHYKSFMYDEAMRYKTKDKK